MGKSKLKNFRIQGQRRKEDMGTYVTAVHVCTGHAYVLSGYADVPGDAHVWGMFR